VNHGAALGEQPTDAARGQVSQHRSQLDIPAPGGPLPAGPGMAVTAPLIAPGHPPGASPVRLVPE
jgi:hypothetical protein